MTEPFITTAIWEETPAAGNSFLAASCRCHGYDLLELCQRRGFVEVLFLLFTGELPEKPQATILEKLMIGLINPGPRHPATRAAINAGLGRTMAGNILPLSLSCLAGDHLGAAEVSAAMFFFSKNLETPASDAATTILSSPRPEEGDWRPAPGFGSRYGAIDPIPRKLSEILATEPGCGPSLRWAIDLAKKLEPQGIGFLATGLAAAVFTDLGLSPWCGAGLFQLMAAPGLLAHGLEAQGQPITTMPSIFDSQRYTITADAKNDHNG